MEHVMDMPLSQDRTVDDYKIQPFSVGVHLFDPVAVSSIADEKLLDQRIANLFVLIAPRSDTAIYRGYPQNIYLREIFRRFNRTLPHMPLHGGAWALSESPAENIAGGYSGVRIEKSMDRGVELPSIGSSDLASAIDRITSLSATKKGSSALIVFGDMRSMGQDVEESILRFRQQGDFNAGFQVLPDLSNWNSDSPMNCFYAVNLTANHSSSVIDDVDSCGFSVAADKVAQPRDMAHFVERVFFSPPADKDGDGIYDYLDQCPGEGRGRIVDSRGCLRFKGDE